MRGQGWAFLLHIEKVKSTQQGLYELSPCALMETWPSEKAWAGAEGTPWGEASLRPRRTGFGVEELKTRGLTLGTVLGFQGCRV